MIDRLFNRILYKLTRRKYRGIDGDIVTTYFSGTYWCTIGPGLLFYHFNTRESMNSTLEANGYTLLK